MTKDKLLSVLVDVLTSLKLKRKSRQQSHKNKHHFAPRFDETTSGIGKRRQGRPVNVKHDARCVVVKVGKDKKPTEWEF